MQDTHKYSGVSIQKLSYLHSFQRTASPFYEQRRTWLSICQVNEWDSVTDMESGHVYFANNVSGETQWDMPQTLEQWSQCADDLTVLNLGSNSLRLLPRSIGTLRLLKRLYLERNHLHSLPYTIGELKSLEYLYVQENELRALPLSITDCSNLIELHAQVLSLEKYAPFVRFITVCIDIFE